MIKKSCIIFDMDGCLVDTERAYIRAWDKAFKKEGIPIKLSIIESWTGKGYIYINNYIADYVGSEEKMLMLRGLREEIFWEELYGGEIPLMPYTEEMLQFVKDSHLLMGVASSTVQEKAEKILKHFNIYDLFDFRVFGNMIQNHKPAPDIYEKAISLSGKTKEECITFEDSASGVMAANAAGIDVIYVPDLGARAPEDADLFKEVSSFKEGIHILREII